MVRRAAVAVAAAACLSACSDLQPSELYFIGDSNVEMWNVADFFPMFITHNYGISGSGVWYLEQSAGKFDGKVVVCMSGINDYRAEAERDREAYADRLVAAVRGLGAAHVFVSSVTPLNNSADSRELTAGIGELNLIIAEKISHEPTMTFVNVFDATVADGVFSRVYSDDGVHYNNSGYNLVAAYMLKAIENEKD